MAITSTQQRCQQCGLPGVRMTTRPGDSTEDINGAYFKCVPCDLVLGHCPCTKGGALMEGSTCPCGERELSQEDQLPRGIALVTRGARTIVNPYNPERCFDEDWHHIVY